MLPFLFGFAWKDLLLVFCRVNCKGLLGWDLSICSLWSADVVLFSSYSFLSVLCFLEVLDRTDGWFLRVNGCFDDYLVLSNIEMLLVLLLVKELLFPTPKCWLIWFRIFHYGCSFLLASPEVDGIGSCLFWDPDSFLPIFLLSLPEGCSLGPELIRFLNCLLWFGGLNSDCFAEFWNEWSPREGAAPSPSLSRSPLSLSLSLLLLLVDLLPDLLDC